MAILSMFGSSFIVFDALRTKRKRGKLLNQMLSTLSFFDILGSIAYAFTTLPTPDSDYLYGSKGNKKTCLGENSHLSCNFIGILSRNVVATHLSSLRILRFQKHKGFSFRSAQSHAFLMYQYPCIIC
mmetsp:Transcript_29180/g.59832  ORF Transcript_29180/g.59832 Transcript_29180/m.59832 type:complete len:127 (-) Transcript_29180:734-1114(-)